MRGARFIVKLKNLFGCNFGTLLHLSNAEARGKYHSNHATWRIHFARPTSAESTSHKNQLSFLNISETGAGRVTMCSSWVYHLGEKSHKRSQVHHHNQTDFSSSSRTMKKILMFTRNEKTRTFFQVQHATIGSGSLERVIPMHSEPKIFFH